MTQEFGKITEHVQFYDSLHYKARHRFFQPFVPRQFFIQQTLYTEREDRLPAWDELFFDLIYVAVILLLGDILKQGKVSLASLQHFCLVMMPIWNTWLLGNKIPFFYKKKVFNLKWIK
jgi:hypothetical protein